MKTKKLLSAQLISHLYLDWYPAVAFNHFILTSPFAPGNFTEKHVLKLVKPFSGHCCAIKS